MFYNRLSCIKSIQTSVSGSEIICYKIVERYLFLVKSKVYIVRNVVLQFLYHFYKLGPCYDSGYDSFCMKQIMKQKLLWQSTMTVSETIAKRNWDNKEHPSRCPQFSLNIGDICKHYG